MKRTKQEEVEPGNWEVTCAQCGKPISVTNENGMFCEDLCGMDKAVEARKVIDRLMADDWYS